MEMPQGVVEGELFFFSDNDSSKGFPHKFKIVMEDNCCEEHAKNKAKLMLSLYANDYNNSDWAKKFGDGVEVKYYE